MDTDLLVLYFIYICAGLVTLFALFQGLRWLWATWLVRRVPEYARANARRAVLRWKRTMSRSSLRFYEVEHSTLFDRDVRKYPRIVRCYAPSKERIGVMFVVKWPSPKWTTQLRPDEVRQAIVNHLKFPHGTTCTLDNMDPRAGAGDFGLVFLVPVDVPSEQAIVSGDF